MPLIRPSSYKSPALLRNRHIHTIYANMCRHVDDIQYSRVRIETPDSDFLDLDYSRTGSDRLAIVAHGLEGNSKRPYILGMVRALNLAGWDAVAWNFRGCSGEPNRNLRFYHSGDTADLHTVLEHILGHDGYRRIDLIGFSLGGNIVLKYIGEHGELLNPSICAAVAFSVPCDLRSGALRMDRFSNRIYMWRFLRMLHEKIRAKMELFPGQIDDEGYSRIKTFGAFDNRYTAKLHGFRDAEDYWAKSSSKPFLHRISIPTLLVNSLDDPFLAPQCYPYFEAEANPRFFLETPEHGGHAGFVAWNAQNLYWSEARTIEFLRMS
jgi:predicted alpha/beta-fold hydrolase